MNAASIFNSAQIRSMREGFEPILRSMKGGAAAIGATTPGSMPIGQQLIETFVVVLVFSIVMQLIESNFAALKRYQAMAITLFPATYDSPQTYPQDPESGYELILPSKDERNGTEYSYSCYISVMPDTFSGEKNTFKHVYHKGSKGVFPLMSPGVFFHSDKNTLRVYQNSSMNWGNFVDIENFPIKKWVHLVVMVKGKALDVYINGNLANRKKFVDLPKLNYGGFYVMLPKLVNQKTKEASCSDLEADIKANAAARAAAGAAVGSALYSAAGSGGLGALGSAAGAAGALASSVAQGDLRGSKTVTTTETDRDLSALPITINGRMNGYISRIKYFAFALSYSQIEKLIREGPNPRRAGGPSNDPLSTSPSISIGYSTTNNVGPIYVPNPNAMDNNLPGYQADAWWTSTDFMGSNMGPEPGNHYGWGPQ